MNRGWLLQVQLEATMGCGWRGERGVIAVLSADARITKVELTGSRDRGQATPLSDWDFAVTATEFEGVRNVRVSVISPPVGTSSVPRVPARLPSATWPIRGRGQLARAAAVRLDPPVHSRTVPVTKPAPAR